MHKKHEAVKCRSAGACPELMDKTIQVVHRHKTRGKYPV